MLKNWEEKTMCFFHNKKKEDKQPENMPSMKKWGEDFVEPSDVDGSEISWSPVWEKSSVYPNKKIFSTAKPSRCDDGPPIPTSYK